MRVNGGYSHDSLKIASAPNVKVMEIPTSGGEITGILKKIKDADPADSHHASLDAAKKQDTVKQDTVTVTILTNLRQGGAVVKEEVVTLTGPS